VAGSGALVMFNLILGGLLLVLLAAKAHDFICAVLVFALFGSAFCLFEAERK
jgi:hypothetical protein